MLFASILSATNSLSVPQRLEFIISDNVLLSAINENGESVVTTVNDSTLPTINDYADNSFLRGAWQALKSSQKQLCLNLNLLQTKGKISSEQIQRIQNKGGAILNKRRMTENPSGRQNSLVMWIEDSDEVNQTSSEEGKAVIDFIENDKGLNIVFEKEIFDLANGSETIEAMERKSIIHKKIDEFLTRKRQLCMKFEKKILELRLQLEGPGRTEINRLLVFDENPPEQDPIEFLNENRIGYQIFPAGREELIRNKFESMPSLYFQDETNEELEIKSRVLPTKKNPESLDIIEIISQKLADKLNQENVKEIEEYSEQVISEYEEENRILKNKILLLSEKEENYKIAKRNCQGINSEERSCSGLEIDIRNTRQSIGGYSQVLFSRKENGKVDLEKNLESWFEHAIKTISGTLKEQICQFSSNHKQGGVLSIQEKESYSAINKELKVSIEQTTKNLRLKIQTLLQVRIEEIRIEQKLGLQQQFYDRIRELEEESKKLRFKNKISAFTTERLKKEISRGRKKIETMIRELGKNNGNFTPDIIADDLIEEQKEKIFSLIDELLAEKEIFKENTDLIEEQKEKISSMMSELEAAKQVLAKNRIQEEIIKTLMQENEELEDELFYPK